MPRFSAKIRQNWISPELQTDCLMDFVFAENNLEINITVLQTIGNILNVFCNLFPFSACQLNYIILFYQFLQKGLMEVSFWGCDQPCSNMSEFLQNHAKTHVRWGLMVFNSSLK